ncbi:MAG: ATP phosphoribosyltransferase [Alphaproteobacteria bacterium]
MKKIILALPKGRILEELKPFFKKINFEVEPEFFNENSRKLTFASSLDFLDVVKVRSFDVATFVKFGGADLGICGLDVIKEFASPQILSVKNLFIGKCRLSIAGKENNEDNILKKWQEKSHLRIATKYPKIANEYFAQLGVQTEIIKLNGSIEIAVKLNLCDYILDLVSSGKTLQENNMSEVKTILEVSSYLVVNRNSIKTNNTNINQVINIFDV